MKNTLLTTRRFLCIEIRMCWIRVAIVKQKKGKIIVEQHAAVTDFDPHQGVDRCIALLTGGASKKQDKKKKVTLPSTAILVTTDAMPGLIKKNQNNRTNAAVNTVLEELQNDIHLYSTPPSLLSFVYYHHHLSMGTSDKGRPLKDDLRYSLSPDQYLIENGVYSEQEMEAISIYLADFTRVVEPLTATTSDPASSPGGKQLSTVSSLYDNEQWRHILENKGIELKAIIPRFSSVLSIIPSAQIDNEVYTLVEYQPGLLLFTNFQSGSISSMKYTEVMTDEILQLIENELNEVKTTAVTFIGLQTDYQNLCKNVPCLTGESFIHLDSSPAELWSIIGAATAVTSRTEQFSPAVIPVRRPPIPFKKRPTTWWSATAAVAAVMITTMIWSNLAELNSTKRELEKLQEDNKGMQNTLRKNGEALDELKKLQKEDEILKKDLASMELKSKKGVVLTRERNDVIASLLEAVGKRSNDVLLTDFAMEKGSRITISGFTTDKLNAAEFSRHINEDLKEYDLIEETSLTTERDHKRSSNSFTLIINGEHK